MSPAERERADRLAQRVIELEEDRRALEGELRRAGDAVLRARAALAILAGAVTDACPVREQNAVRRTLGDLAAAADPAASLASAAMEAAVRYADRDLADRAFRAMRGGLI